MIGAVNVGATAKMEDAVADGTQLAEVTLNKLVAHGTQRDGD